MRAVLRGVIAANLVIGAAIGGAQVNVFELAALHSEGAAGLSLDDNCPGAR